MSDMVRVALDQSSDALGRGDSAEAKRLLAKARQLDPNSLDIIYSQAILMAHMGEPEAIDLLEMLLKSQDVGELWLSMSVARVRFGDITGAAQAMSMALSRNGLSNARAILTAAIRIARQTRMPGACGLETSGQVVVALSRKPRLSPLKVRLDGRPVKMNIETRRTMSIIRLPSSWELGDLLEVTSEGHPLLGSPILVKSIVALEGFVWAEDGCLEGWAWHPNDVHSDPTLTITSIRTGRSITIIAADRSVKVPFQRFMAAPRRFVLGVQQLRQLPGLLRVTGRNGRDLYGSPIDPGAWPQSALLAAENVARLYPGVDSANKRRLFGPGPALQAVPAHIVGRQAKSRRVPRPVDIVIPVYGARLLTQACIQSVLHTLPGWARIVVVDDASPDTTLVRELRQLARAGGIILMLHRRNRGFPEAANTGMRQGPGRDVVLLNSDTLVSGDWLERLRTAAYSSLSIGTATPMSNDATILSFPIPNSLNSIPTAETASKLDAMAKRANGGAVVEIPTAVGFCTYIKRDCLDQVGLFRSDLFAQGYGEENDFSIRARHLGWQHIVAPGIFVAHVGGQSFGTAKQHLITRNLKTLNTLHPGYDALIQSFVAADPLAEARRRIDREVWIGLRRSESSVLLVTHGRAGGVRRRVEERAVALRADGLRPIVLWPVANRIGGRDCVLGDGPSGGTPNLRFSVPGELDDLAELLRGDKPLRAEVHHLIGHDHAILGLFSRLGIPYEIIIHDYSWFCPRINLVDGHRRYCGEPAVVHCEACVADNGSFSEESIPVTELVARSTRELYTASRVVVPSKDVASRMSRHFPLLACEVVPWEDDRTLASISRSPAPTAARMRVAVVGAISVEKGYDILLAIARDAMIRDLPIEFVIVGFSYDDARLLATGRVHITGQYSESDVVELIRRQEAHCAFLPSVWPETWSYTLSQSWQAGMDVAVFDIGTPAERVREAGRGWVLPLAAPARIINQGLIETWAQARGRLLAKSPLDRVQVTGAPSAEMEVRGLIAPP